MDTGKTMGMIAESSPPHTKTSMDRVDTIGSPLADNRIIEETPRVSGLGVSSKEDKDIIEKLFT